MPATQQRHPDVDLDAVLDAAAACYLRYGVAKTTAVDIALVLGISRATLYRRFGSHEAIFLDVLARESAAMAADAEAHLAGIDDPDERMLEGMVFAIGRRTWRTWSTGSCASSSPTRPSPATAVGRRTTSAASWPPGSCRRSKADCDWRNTPTCETVTQ